MNRSLTLILSLALLALAGGCKTNVESSAPASGGVRSAPASGPAATPAADPKPGPSKRPAVSGKVKRIVFLDIEKACACTKKRIAASWNALAAALGKPAAVPVERIHMDTQPLRAATYKAKRPVMVPPAVYLLGMEDKLLEVLQGEVTADQIKKVLK